jgi:hypothetical protein
MSTNSDPESFLPFSQAVRTPLPDNNDMESQPANEAFDDITTDLESHNHNSHGGGPVS